MKLIAVASSPKQQNAKSNKGKKGPLQIERGEDNEAVTKELEEDEPQGEPLKLIIS